MHLFRLSSVIFLLLFTCAFAAPYTQLRTRETDSTSSTNTRPKIRILFDLLRDTFLLHPDLRAVLPRPIIQENGSLGLEPLPTLSTSQRAVLLQLRQKVDALFPQAAHVVENINQDTKGNALPLIDSILDGLNSRSLSSGLHEDNNMNDPVIGMVSNALDDFLTTVFGGTSPSPQTVPDYCQTDTIIKELLCEAL